MASVWVELKRRNVVRVAIAYAVVAWLLLQVADVVLGNIEAPAWLFQAILFLLVIGFPVALIFAWAFELTPDGLKKEKNVDRSQSITPVTGRRLDFIIIGVLVVALAVFSIERFVLLPGRTPAIEAAREIVAADVRQSIAVLPFVNMSSDPEQEYLSDGMSEEILNLLTKIPNLKVIARTSSFSFKGKNDDVRVIGQALGVKTVLEGSVRKAGDQIRITAQLIDVSDGAHIWSDTYDRTLTDIFAIQDDVAAAIIDALQIHVGAMPARARPTDNTEAYALFLKARALLNAGGRSEPEMQLLKATELDPMFAEAYELLAYLYWIMSNQRGTSEAAAKALAINPDLPLARPLYQSANVGTRMAEIEAFERAAREQPGNPEILSALGWRLLNVGYLEEAVHHQERAVDLDPLASETQKDLGLALYAVGRTNEAVAAIELAGRLSSNLIISRLGDFHLVENQDESAIAFFEGNIPTREYVDATWVRDLVSGTRNSETGQAHLDRRIPEIIASVPEDRPGRRQFWLRKLTTWYLIFGFNDRHIDIILDLDPTDSAWEQMPDLFLFDSMVFRRSGFTAHPKFLEVAETMGLVEIWDQRGPPDFCSKSSGQWVCE